LPFKDKEEESKSARGDQETHEDDFVINIQDDEAEIGPIDDEVEDMGPGFHHVAPQDHKQEYPVVKEANADLLYEQTGADGAYYDGDEPEEDDSQAGLDDQEDFDCADEDGEEDLLGAEEGEEETAVAAKADEPRALKSEEAGVKETEVDMHSKVSTACTNGENALIKIKQTSEGKSKRKSTKTKKGAKGRSKAYGEGLEDLEGLDEE